MKFSSKTPTPKIKFEKIQNTKSFKYSKINLLTTYAKQAFPILYFPRLSNPYIHSLYFYTKKEFTLNSNENEWQKEENYKKSKY